MSKINFICSKPGVIFDFKCVFIGRKPVAFNDVSVFFQIRFSNNNLLK